MRRELRSARYDKLRALLTQARLKQGMTQVDLADKLRQPQSLISKIEGGERRIDVIEFVDICRAVGLSPSEVITQLE